MDIQSIFQTWVHVLTRPGEASFEAEREKSSATLTTALVWVIIANVIAALLGWARAQIFPSEVVDTTETFLEQFGSDLPAEVPPELLAMGDDVLASLSGASGLANLGIIVLAPIAFLIGIGVYHLIASILGGRGQFGRYAYLSATFSAPIAIVGAIVGFVPVLGGCVGGLLAVYGLALAYLATKVEYGLSAGRAMIVVALPILLLAVLAVCAIALTVGQVISAVQL